MDAPRPPRLHQRLLLPLVSLLGAPAILPVLVLAAGLGATTLLWRDAAADVEQELQADFDARTREFVNLLDQRLHSYLQVLYGVQGLFYSSQNVDRREFRTYLDSQDLARQFPGLRAIAYVRRVDGDQRDAFEATVQREAGDDYRIMPAGVRHWYAPTVYAEQAHPSAPAAVAAATPRALGFDAASEPLRRAALERARDTGLPALSGAVRLLEDRQEAPRSAFVLALPLYGAGRAVDTEAARRAALHGWVLAPFRVRDLLAGLGTARTATLALDIYDGDALRADARVYAGIAALAGGSDARATSTSTSMVEAAGSLRSSVQQIALGGQRWTLHIAAPSGMPAGGTARMRLILAGGVLLSLLGAGLTWGLAHGRRATQAALARSTALAAELKEGSDALLAMAEADQRSQAMLRSILDATLDGILVDDFKGTVLSANRRCRELWHVPEYLDWDSDGAVLLAHMREQLASGAGHCFDDGPDALPAALEQPLLLCLRDGRVIEQTTRTLQLGREPARVRSFRDITGQVHADRCERLRRSVLEQIAADTPLAAILASVVADIEAANTSLRCHIVLYGAEDAETGAAGPGWSEPIVGAIGEAIGILRVVKIDGAAPGMTELQFIARVAQLLGMAVEQAQAAVAVRRLNDELRVMATTDFLTGLPNRREFMRRLADEEARLLRDIGACTAVLLLDIDHFKRVNDEHGHAGGDAVLRQLSALMLEEQRKIDVLGRIGGEEFAMLLPGTALAAALVFAERLRQRVAEAPLLLDADDTGTAVQLALTVSIGVAVMGADQPGGDAALRRADLALYAAKGGGRNRVVSSHDVTTAPLIQ